MSRIEMSDGFRMDQICSVKQYWLWFRTNGINENESNYSSITVRY